MIEDGVDADARDRARERRARAHVGAVAEREVLVGVRAIDEELVGAVEDALVAIRRGGADDHALARVHRATADLGVAHAPARQEQDRRRGAQALLDRVAEERPIGAHGRFERG